MPAGVALLVAAVTVQCTGTSALRPSLLETKVAHGANASGEDFTRRKATGRDTNASGELFVSRNSTRKYGNLSGKDFVKGSSTRKYCEGPLEPNRVGCDDQCDRDACMRVCNAKGMTDEWFRHSGSSIYCARGWGPIAACAATEENWGRIFIHDLCSQVSGKGSVIMQSILQHADAQNDEISLDCADDGSGKLIGYYQKFGFKGNGGRMTRPRQRAPANTGLGGLLSCLGGLC
eukprot:TRINITY_DN74572_c0_g1_i1.p1 TRINITY_DN74572_c0_g1~~TRINITY_DN74572_c0_g1_i1.p1  ORF type:complete len:256 (-),score=13.93 TRINITY_DN74572_c0_g1_i1:28-726(-)